MKQIPFSALYVKITYHATCMTQIPMCWNDVRWHAEKTRHVSWHPPPPTPIPPIQPLLHPFLQPDFPPPSPHIHTDWHFNYFVIRCKTPSSHPIPRPMRKIPRVANLSTLVPLCIPASLLIQPLTSSLLSLSLLSKPILSLLHQLRWAEAHCAKCHLISLSLAAAVIVRTFPLFLSSAATFFLLSLSAVLWRDYRHRQHHHHLPRTISAVCIFSIISSSRAGRKNDICACMLNICVHLSLLLLSI